MKLLHYAEKQTTFHALVTERYLLLNRFISIVLYSDMKSDLSYHFPAFPKDQILCQLQYFNKSAIVFPALLEIANVSERVCLLKALGS